MRVATVITNVSGLTRQHLAIRIRRRELCEADDHGRQAAQLFARQIPDYSLAGELLPPRFSLAVVQDHVRPVNEPADAEPQNAALKPAVKSYRAVADRAEGHCDGNSSDHVVDHFVPDDYLHRVSAAHAVDLKRDNRLVVR
jgi:hypothetical protein